MRECWINVYPNITVAGQVYCGPPQPSRGLCVVSAIGWAAAEESGRSVAKDLRYVGVGYRLHVRLKPTRLDSLEEIARQWMTSPDPLMRERGGTRVKMIEAARAKGMR